MSQLLLMQGVSKRFGPTVALDNVSLAANAGEVLALVGENGAGKSTLMKILSGALTPDAGSMLISGKRYVPRRPQDARLAGVSMIYQELNIAPDLSVEENILLGQERSRWGMVRRTASRTEAHQAMARLGHERIELTQPAGALSVGEQQLVEIARSLVTRAKVIVLDEPTSSLTQHDAQLLFEVIQRLKAEGVALIYISHFLEEIRDVCDRFVVLRDGCRVSGGALEDTTNDEIVAHMVGRSVDQLFPVISHEIREVVLTVNRLSGRTTPESVNLALRRGEIMGIAGLVGAGRTELLRGIYALDEVRRGSIKVGEISPPARPRARIRAGLGYVSEDRKSEGLAQDRSVIDNLTLSHLAPFSRWGWLSLPRRRAAADRLCRQLQVKLHSSHQPIRSLSGGNQQKIALARVLHQDADVLLLDEPTRGIDVGTKAEVYRLIGELAAAGKAILFVSSYLPELLAVCDTVGVMARGRLREIRPAREWTEEAIMTCAIDLDPVDVNVTDDAPHRGPRTE